MKSSRNTGNHSPGGPDDLQNIKGIGKSIALALKELGIHTYAELAACTPEQLLEQLKGRLPPIALQRARPDEWIRQARERIAEQQAGQPDSPAQSEKPRRNWREIADFFVSFGYESGSDGIEHLKTRAHHSQGDQLMEWDGLETEGLIAWILSRAELEPAEQAGEPNQQQAFSELVASLPSQSQEGSEAVHIELSNLWVEEVNVPVMAKGQVPASLLRLRSDLQISGPDGESSTYERLEYNLELYLIDTETKQSMLVRTFTGRLSPGQMEYPLQQDFEIPPVGRYQLFVAATLPASNATAAHLQGPIIEVEA